MNINDLKDLIKVIDKSSINDLKLEIDNMKLELSKNIKVVNTTALDSNVLYESTNEERFVSSDSYDDYSVCETTQVDDSNIHVVCAPIIGTFYSAPSPDAPNFVSVGDKVSKDSTMCILEAMKLMNEIKAEIDGEIVEILVDNESLVEYNQPLFKIRSL